MDQTAIKAIADLSTAQLAAKDIGSLGAIVMPEGHKLQSTEHLLPAPAQFRGRFNTSVLSQFISYIATYGGNNTNVFINQDVMSAKVIIDMGDTSNPQWGKHQADVRLKRTPAFNALMSQNDERLGQQEFIDFAEDWQENILFYYGEVDGAKPESFKSIINTLRRLKSAAIATASSEVGNFSGSRSALEQVAITAGDAEPPTGFVFRTIPYDGFEAVSFDCQIRAIVSDKKVELKYRISQLERHKEQLAEQFKNQIVSGIDINGISVFIGDMEYQK